MQPSIPPRYRVIRRLGKGGEAPVWLAADRFRAGARVAIKLVPPAAGRIDSLRREFLTLVRLAHPGIARVRDFGLLPGGRGAYFTSDYVAGGNLLEWSGELRGAERWRALLDVAHQALCVLQYLSLRGLCHGDVKPANLLVASGPEALRPGLKVIDFGMAELRGRGNGARGGTAAYLPAAPVAAGGIDPDLFALGLSLFHAGTGRLPFALGDPVAHAAWLAAGEPARARVTDPSAPRAADELIAGLTSVRGEGRFRAATDALEFLRGKVSLPPPPRPSPDDAPSAGRERFVDGLLEEIAGGARRQVLAISSSLELGRLAVVEAIEARLQALGWATISFLPGSLPRGLRSAAELLGLRLEAGSPPPPAMAARLASAMGRVAILADWKAIEEAAGEGTVAVERLLAEAARLASSAPARGRLLLIVAADDAGSAARRLGIPEEALGVRPLEPLSAAEVRDLAREFFSVESIPGDLVRRIEMESRGIPGLVREALEALAGAGVTADFLGHLTVPGELPGRLVSSGPGSLDPGSLPAHLREALGLVALASEPLDAAGLALRFPAIAVAEWRIWLESLRARGYLRREEDGSGAMYRPGRAVAVDAASLLGPGTAAARRSLVERLLAIVERARRPPAATCLSLARNALALGDFRAALNWGRKAAREIRRGDDDLDAGAAFIETIEAAEQLPAPLAPRLWRALQAFRLRGAQALAHASRSREALRLLAPGDGRSPAWNRALSRARADVHERMGDPTAAAREVEGILATAGALEEGSPPDADAIADVARLAALRFKAGRGREGRSLLERARSLFAHRSVPGGARVADPREARLLGLLAGIEAAHGDRQRAVTLLEAWLRLTRDWPRGDLPLGPLNELGILHAEDDRHEEALAVFAEIEERARARGDHLGALKAVHNQAIIHYRRRDLDHAQERFQEARLLSESLGPSPHAVTVLIGLAGVLRERGRLVAALRIYRKIVRSRAAGAGSVSPTAIRDRALALHNAAELYLTLGRLDRCLFHANQAYRQALRTDDRFLRGLTLRGRGIARWALGRAAEAARDLERAGDLARAAGDLRGRALSEHFLGLLERARGEAGALRRLRAAVLLSRSADAGAGGAPARGSGFSQCVAHLPAARAAFFGELLRRDRRRAARLLLVRPPRPGAPQPSLALRAAALRAREEWPANHELLAADCREAARAGLIWDAFQVLADALRDPRLAGEPLDALVLERDTLAVRLLRFLPRRREGEFRRFWDLGEEPGSVEMAEAGAEDRDLPPAVTSPQEALGPIELLLEKVDGEERSVLPLLAALRTAIGARAVWLLEDPPTARRPLVAGEARGGLRALLRTADRTLAAARSRPGLVAEGARLFLKLPHATAARVVCAEGPSARWARSPTVQEGLITRVAALALAVRLLEIEEGLGVETQRRERADDELHRLNTLLAKGTQLETEFLSRQIELRDLDRSHAATSQGNARKRLVAASPALRSLLARLRKVAERDIPLLLIGESGVGKDLIARWVHEASPRAERPFVAELCNVPESLMEAELFGYARGAFTGAVEDRQGLFRRVAGGTLYLDEVTDLPENIQAKCLRVIAEKSVRPLGGDQVHAVDFRLISSSRSSIAELEANRGMRADFLYRINAEVAEIPPLRERREDIRPIVEEVLHEWADRNAAAEPYLHPEACARLEEHSWPGNARELVNEIERVLVARPIEITPDMLFANLLVSSPRAAPVPSFREERNRMERTLLIRALEMERGNATQAAKVLKITRRYLGTLLAKHGIELERFRERVSSPLTGDGRPGGKKRGKPSRGEARQQGPREKGSRQNRSDST